VRAVVVLDSDGLSGVGSNKPLQALLREVAQRGGEVWCSAVKFAETARGPRRSAEVHQALRKRHGGPTIRVRAADQTVGFLVGALLHDANRGSEAIADAFVVATCAPFEAALVITSDPSDISVLASHLPGVRITLRRPDLGDH
jgi:hypothetical protein